MPRNSQAPRASEVHWLSAEEKEAALAQLPEVESFSNYVRRIVFNLPPLQHGGARKGADDMTIQDQITKLKAEIATNLKYAKAYEKSFSDAQAATCYAAIARKKAQIKKLEQRLIILPENISLT